MERNFPKVVISKKGELALKGGHPWVYEGEVKKLIGSFVNGELVDVFSEK